MEEIAMRLENFGYPRKEERRPHPHRTPKCLDPVYMEGTPFLSSNEGKMREMSKKTK